MTFQFIQQSKVLNIRRQRTHLVFSLSPCGPAEVPSQSKCSDFTFSHLINLKNIFKSSCFIHPSFDVVISELISIGCKWISQVLPALMLPLCGRAVHQQQAVKHKQVLTSTSLLTFSMNFSFCSSVTYTFCMLFLKSMSLKVGSSFPFRD